MAGRFYFWLILNGQYLQSIDSHGTYSVRSGTGEVSLRLLRFPPGILIPLPAPHSLIILAPTLYRLDTDSVFKEPA
jgi:hypothetical protein